MRIAAQTFWQNHCYDRWHRERKEGEQMVICRLKTLISSAVAAQFVMWAVSANATILPKKNFDELLKESDGIVMGTVSDMQSQYAGTSRDIVTHVTLSNLTVLHGQFNAPQLVLRMDGGNVSGDIVHIEGSPSFSLQDRVIVFVKGNGSAMVPFVGWTQGVFRVFRDAGSGVDRVKDHDGNLIREVRGNDIVKDTVHAAEARIVGPNGRVSEAIQGIAGRTDDGTPSTNVEAREASAGDAMGVLEFVNAIRRGVRDRALQGKALNSADPKNAAPRPSLPKVAPPRQ
jgi:hypothetical protein